MEITSLDAADFYRLLDERQEPSLVIFTSLACGSCARLRQVLREASLEVEGLSCLEVSAESAYGLLEEHAVFHLPGVFLYARGDCLGPVEAELKAESLQRAILGML